MRRQVSVGNDLYKEREGKSRVPGTSVITLVTGTRYCPVLVTYTTTFVLWCPEVRPVVLGVTCTSTSWSCWCGARSVTV